MDNLTNCEANTCTKREGRATAPRGICHYNRAQDTLDCGIPNTQVTGTFGTFENQEGGANANKNHSKKVLVETQRYRGRATQWP